MKCLKVAGDTVLRKEFISRFCKALSDRVICVISADSSGELEAKFPGESSITVLLESMPPDLVIIPADSKLVVPEVFCGMKPSSGNSLVLAVYPSEGADTDFALLYRSTFNLLPQKNEEECGRCGMDCQHMAEAILRGEKGEEDCFYANGDVEIRIDGRSIEVGKFPASMIDGAVRGLLSSMKGYRKDSDVTVKLRS